MVLTLRQSLQKRLLNGEYNCEKELTLSLMSGKWKIVILWHLGHEGPLRYGELFRLFKNISNRILTKQLRELEQDGIIYRNVFDEVPPRVEYHLTELGRTLVPIVDEMFEWGKTNMQYYAELARKNVQDDPGCEEAEDDEEEDRQTVFCSFGRIRQSERLLYHKINNRKSAGKKLFPALFL